ncbi:MAG: hypothetical protein EBX94_01110, partial [Burkholderiaceae bacterium]|nr:hypothetical protein [Burkholderiaceae bacterium]
MNAFCFLDRDAAERDAKNADISLPFGGVPFGVKELDSVAGWPDTEACMVFKDRRATTTDTQVNRICRVGGAVQDQYGRILRVGLLDRKIGRLLGRADAGDVALPVL